ncbi:hypothetical protein SAMN03097699_3057 [Flavobacteriaceae bacterium MAR_2010_188]|nr:hypothetical protein SAMN03097699_3057 [Flavobacteriaceae bacterium MAR_2010_188]
MDEFLIVLAGILMVLGVLGSFLPIIPGPITSWVGLLVFYLAPSIPINWTFLIITGVIALIISILDYVIPAAGTKKFGGSKAGMIGTTVGLLVGIIAPIPGGIIIGPFVGALIGEMINKNDFNIAFKAAIGSFLGFLASTFIKFLVCMIYLGLFIVKLIKFSGEIF